MKSALVILFFLFTSQSFALDGARLEALCERGDGDAYMAVWSKDGALELDYSGDFTLGPATIEKSDEAIKITAEQYYDPVVIPRGKNEVDILGSLFNCDY